MNRYDSRSPAVERAIASSSAPRAGEPQDRRQAGTERDTGRRRGAERAESEVRRREKAGAPAIKGATLTVTVDYETTAPLA